MSQDLLIITSFLAVTVCVFSFIAVYIFNFEPSLGLISLLILSGYMAIHPAFGFSISSYLKLSSTAEPQLEALTVVEKSKPNPSIEQTIPSEPDKIIHYYELSCQVH